MKNKLLVFTTLSVLCLLVLFCKQEQNLSFVSVSGNRFVDEDGNIKVFRGLCFSGPDKLEKNGQWNENIFAVAASWGAIVDYLEKTGASWTVWCFDPHWSPQLIKDWDFTPTWQWEFFRQKMTRLNR